MDYTTSIYEDSHGILWVGSMRALGQMDRKSGRMTFYRAAGGPGELSSTWIISIVEDRSGYLWFGTVGAGLNRLDRRTGKFNVYRHDPTDPHSLSHDTVPKLFVDSRGILWAGTEDGLDEFDPVTERFRTYKVSGLSDNRAHDIAEDSEGALWIATRSTGLLRLDPVTRQFTVYRHSQRSGTLSNDQANSVCVDHAGIVWVGTESGLNGFDPVTRNFNSYYKRDGLANSNVSSILEDRRGDLWVSTSNGLSRFNVRGKTFKNYYLSDGIAGDEFYNYASAWKSLDGEMFFTSYAGLTTFFPQDVVDDPYAPPVVITDFKLSGNSVPIGGNSLLKRAISFTDTVTLTHTQNVLSLEFSSLSFTNPEGNRYRYRLEGLETRWNESEGNQRFITYALSPGNYVFRVQGSNSRGAWNEQGASVRLVILPPWWSTWWFRTAELASMLLSLGYAYHLRLRSIERQFNMRLEERVGERTRIARDLHDTLLQSFHGLILRFQTVYDLFPTRPAEARKTLESAIDQAAQAITEGRDAVQGLRSSKVETSDLAVAIRTLGEELAADESNQVPTVFHVDVEGTPRSLHPILRDEVYRIAGEALRNAFRHAQARQIEVEIRYDVRQLRLRVRDAGKGMDPKLLREDGRAGHFGLRGMRERAKLVGGTLTVWSELDSGTEVELSIPASLAYSTPAAPRHIWLSEKLFGKGLR
jgi:signal transduction histidine kinase/streptogramin lyase